MSTINAQATPFRELNAVLVDLTTTVRDILGDRFVGAYVQGSFALGDGDIHSDCDFIVAVTEPVSGAPESALRALHDEIPLRPGHWTKHLEGSYADVATLGDTGAIGTPWLFLDHGHRELIWDPHCNSAVARWIMHHHGVTLAGPPAASLVPDVPAQVMRDAMRAYLAVFWDDLSTWAPWDIAWAQRYAVATCCRALYTLDTARVASKRGALEWARDHLDPQWRNLLTQVLEDRRLGLAFDDPPRPGSLEAAREFARYAESRSLSI